MATETKNKIMVNSPLPTLKEYSTALITLLDKSPNELVPFFKGLAPNGCVDVDKCLDEGTPLSVWNRVHGKSTTAKMIAILLLDLVNTFNVSRPMTGAQIQDLAVDMSNDLWEYRMEEIGAFFQAVKRGSYGKVYERIDAPFIWEMWEKYLDERFKVIEVRRNAKIFRDPTITQKTREDVTAGKMVQLGDAFKDMKEKLKG